MHTYGYFITTVRKTHVEPLVLNFQTFLPRDKNVINIIY